MYHQYFLEKWENLEDDQVLENFTLSNLVTEYSPTLPEDFPKEKLPKNLCQKELLKLNKCINFRDEQTCNGEFSLFLYCKNRRDVSTFNSIKKWEKENFETKNLEQRKDYLDILIKNVAEKEDVYKRVPTAYIYRPKRFRLKADIDQLEWRISYLKKTNQI